MGRKEGVTDAQMLALGSYRESPAFDDVEKLVIEYAELMTETPVKVPDALFDRLKARFDAAQLVELTASIAWENYRARFDHAFGIDSMGLSAGAVKAEPEGADSTR